MDGQKQQKICYNCNGQVDLEVIVCPFCGTDLLEEFDAGFDLEEELDSKQKSLSPQETIASLYPAPYQIHPEEENQETADNLVEKAHPLSFLLFIFAINFVCIGLLLFFFSKDGKVQLDVSSKYWFIWVLIGSISMLWSWKKIDET